MTNLLPICKCKLVTYEAIFIRNGNQQNAHFFLITDLIKLYCLRQQTDPDTNQTAYTDG